MSTPIVHGHGVGCVVQSEIKDQVKNVGNGLMVTAPTFSSRGQQFDSTSAFSKFGQFHSPHFVCVFRKRH